MKRYTFSKKGKIRNILYNVVLFTCLIFVVEYLKKFILPFSLYIILQFFLIGFMLVKVFFILTIAIQVNNLGITCFTIMNISSTISWNEIEYIEIIDRKSRVSEIRFYKEGKCFFNLWDDIENHNLLFQEIINNAKVNNVPIVNLSFRKGNPFF